MLKNYFQIFKISMVVAKFPLVEVGMFSDPTMLTWRTNEAIDFFLFFEYAVWINKTHSKAKPDAISFQETASLGQ